MEESIKKLGLIELDPKELLVFEITSKCESAKTGLILYNRSEKDVIFKVKPSNAKSFIISPMSSIVKAKQNLRILFTYEYSQNTINLIHKFLIILTPFVVNSPDLVD